jgi:hypothetical protein
MTSGELERRVIGLVDQTEARLNDGRDFMPERVHSMREMAEAGEWGIALECLCDNLHDFGVRLTTHEISEVEALARHMGMPDERWDFIRELRA